MLKHLYIKNFALIDELDIELHPGFSVITGETGAGKSIILGAIGLLLGQRADSKALKQGELKCTIEAHFDLSKYELEPFFQENDIEYDAEDCIIRRELTAAGKSRAFINDTPVPLNMLKELGEQLVDVHSQHQNLLLGKQDFQLNLIDILAGDGRELDSYRQAFAAYQSEKNILDNLRSDIERNRQNMDFLQFQYDELTAARLESGELELLEQKSDLMTHSEDIKTALYTADTALQGEEGSITASLRSAIAALKSISRVFPEAAELTERMDSAYIELKDIAQEVSNHLEQVDFDPAELDRVNDRLDRLYSIQKKYHTDSIEELIALRDDLSQKLSHIENSDETITEQEQKVAKLKADCDRQAEKLTQLRTKVARRIEKEMQERLVPLGMPHVRFSITLTKVEPGRNGQDQIAFLFSANSSTPLLPLAQVASGGETARVMLSLKAMISNAVKLPTIIFDEIDTGVSGKMAEKMAEIMQEMGQHERQVISITHLPQIAALGTSHYRVSKEETPEGTISHMTELKDTARIREIAQMLSGKDVSEAAIQNAKQLLRIDN
jgi:DNA repair protein RecN (Recombination protein N)